MYLLIQTKQAREDFSSIQSEWSEVSESMFQSYRQVGFLQFLELWRDGKETDAKVIASLLSNGSKEKKGTAFLLDPRAVAEKEINLRREISDENCWFADFLIGEQYLKNGNHQHALDAYYRSLKSIQKLSQDNKSVLDMLFIEHLMAQLYSLERLNNSFDNISAVEGGD